MILQNNAYLVSLRGLEALQVVGGDLSVERCGSSISLSRLDQMVVDERWEQSFSVSIGPGSFGADSRVPDEHLHFPRRRGPAGGVARKVCHALCTGLYNEDTLAALSSMHGLDSLQLIGGNFVVNGNPELLSFHGLDNLSTVSGALIVQHNLKLENLLGSELLADIGGLKVEWNPLLRSIDGLDGLTTVGSLGIEISRNEVLEELGHWPNLVSVAGDMVIWQNHHLLAPTLQDSGLGPPVRLIRVDNIGGFVSIEDNRRLNSLSGLASLQSINGGLYILRNDALVDLSGGLESLSSVGGDFYVQGGMQNYVGLDSLVSVSGSLIMHGQYDLMTAEGLGALVSIGKNFVVHLNPKLESLAELVSLETVGERVEIYGNPDLEHIDAMLDSLKAVGHYLKIDFANGTIDCPRGTGLGLGDVPLVYDTTVQDISSLGSPSEQTFGNWCTFNCRYPRLVDSPEKRRMWECREDDMWSASWGVLCV